MDGGYSIINNDSTKRKEEVLGAIERLKGSLIDEGKSLEYYRKERLSVYDTSSVCSDHHKDEIMFPDDEVDAFFEEWKVDNNVYR